MAVMVTVKPGAVRRSRWIGYLERCHGVRMALYGNECVASFELVDVADHGVGCDLQGGGGRRPGGGAVAVEDQEAHRTATALTRHTPSLVAVKYAAKVLVPSVFPSGVVAVWVTVTTRETRPL